MPRQWTLVLYGVMLVCAADIAAVLHLNGIYPFIAMTCPRFMYQPK